MSEATGAWHVPDRWRGFARIYEVSIRGPVRIEPLVLRPCHASPLDTLADPLGVALARGRAQHVLGEERIPHLDQAVRLLSELLFRS